MTEVHRSMRLIEIDSLADKAEDLPERPRGEAVEPVSAASAEEMSAQGRTPLAMALERQLDEYFVWLDGRKPHPIYDLVLQAVERPLFEYVMKRCRYNQCAAAKLLGINRNTLRKKLAEHGLLPSQGGAIHKRY